MISISDPLTAVSLVLTSIFALGLILIGGPKRGERERPPASEEAGAAG
jgi:hypothetical protein